MFYVQVNIGRNVAGVPMSELDWSRFGSAVSYAISQLAEGMGQWHPNEEFSLSDSLEIHEGRGHWGGTGEPDEESTHYSILLDRQGVPNAEMARLMTWFGHELAYLAEVYGQDAIALITGSKLIKARKS